MKFYDKPIGENFCYSPCGKYRYKRWIKWSNERPCVFILQHPVGSTKEKPSRTAQNCRKVARMKKCGGIISVNLCAYITKSETILLGARDNDGKDIVGTENEKYLYDALTTPDALIIVAWGNVGGHSLKNEADNFKRIAKDINKDIWCLKITKQGQPHHPARFPVNDNLELVKFPLD